MSSKVYVLKKYNSSEYIDFSEEVISLDIPNNSSPLKLILLDKEVNQVFEKIHLPKKSYDDLKKLLTHFDLFDFEKQFLSFIAQVQDNYLLYSDYDSKDKLANNFLNEKKDTEKLFDVLKLYLFGDKNELFSISFKFLTSGAKTINNFFIVDDIYKSLIQYYDLNEDNFEERKKKILSDFVNNFNYKKGRTYIIMESVQSLYDFIKKEKNGISDNEALKFCGVFLHICQIPSNNKTNDISIGEIKDSLYSIDYQNLRHHINRKSNYWI